MSEIVNAATFSAGDGTMFGLVSLKGSGQVVAFFHDGDAWRGCCQFGRYESQGIYHGEALPEVAAALSPVPAPVSEERCPTCGSPVEVVSSGEGTSHYRRIGALTEEAHGLRVRLASLTAAHAELEQEAERLRARLQDSLGARHAVHVIEAQQMAVAELTRENPTLAARPLRLTAWRRRELRRIADSESTHPDVRAAARELVEVLEEGG